MTCRALHVSEWLLLAIGVIPVPGKPLVLGKRECPPLMGGKHPHRPDTAPCLLPNEGSSLLGVWQYQYASLRPALAHLALLSLKPLRSCQL